MHIILKVVCDSHLLALRLGGGRFCESLMAFDCYPFTSPPTDCLTFSKW